MVSPDSRNCLRKPTRSSRTSTHSGTKTSPVPMSTSRTFGSIAYLKRSSTSRCALLCGSKSPLPSNRTVSPSRTPGLAVTANVRLLERPRPFPEHAPHGHRATLQRPLQRGHMISCGMPGNKSMSTLPMPPHPPHTVTSLGSTAPRPAHASHAGMASTTTVRRHPLRMSDKSNGTSITCVRLPR